MLECIEKVYIFLCFLCLGIFRPLGISHTCDMKHCVVAYVVVGTIIAQIGSWQYANVIAQYSHIVSYSYDMS